LIVDTSALLAYLDDQEPRHAACTEAIEASADDLVVSPFVVAELDYLLTTRHGVEAELASLRELTGGAWVLATFAESDLEKAAQVIERYADQDVGVVHASIVVLAQRYETRTIATLDRRHFDVLRPLNGGRFRVLP
jgi:uncharacterized protein